jgi:hypothetical protein
MQNLKSKILTKAGQILWLSLITFILSIIAGSTLYVFAAFTEPTAGPAASDQDFSENILGANNADNDFDSSSVVASTTGSIIERLQYIQDNYLFDTTNLHYMAYDDYNCSNNNAESDSACAAGDAEYTGEEGSWSSITDASLGTETIASGKVYQDARTGLYWSDCYSSAQDGSCDQITNDFHVAASICTDAQINSGTCDIAALATTSAAITFCQDLELDADGDGTNETDWYLPSQKELMLAYINGAANNVPNPAYTFWSATEYYSNSSYAWYVRLYNGSTTTNTKTFNVYARCARR